MSWKSTEKSMEPFTCVLKNDKIPWSENIRIRILFRNVFQSIVREQVTRPRKTFLHTPSSSIETDFTLQIDCLIYVLFRSNCLIRSFWSEKKKNLLDVFERSLLSSHCFHKIQIQLICNLLTEFSNLAKVIFEGATYLLLLDSSWREKKSLLAC